MLLNKEDKQIIDKLEKEDKEHVLDLIKEVDAHYEILSHLESITTELEVTSIEEKDKGYLKGIKFKLYNRLDFLEKEISNILNDFWKKIMRTARRKRKLINKKFAH